MRRAVLNELKMCSFILLTTTSIYLKPISKEGSWRSTLYTTGVKCVRKYVSFFRDKACNCHFSVKVAGGSKKKWRDEIGGFVRFDAVSHTWGLPGAFSLKVRKEYYKSRTSQLKTNVQFWCSADCFYRKIPTLVISLFRSWSRTSWWKMVRWLYKSIYRFVVWGDGGCALCATPLNECRSVRTVRSHQYQKNDPSRALLNPPETPPETHFTKKPFSGLLICRWTRR